MCLMDSSAERMRLYLGQAVRTTQALGALGPSVADQVRGRSPYVLVVDAEHLAVLENHGRAATTIIGALVEDDVSASQEDRTVALVGRRHGRTASELRSLR